MQKLSPIEINEICEELGETYPKSIEQVHGGDIHSAWRIEFSNKKLFLKRNIRNKKFLEFEKYCLQILRKYHNQENLVIPEVIAYKKRKNIEILLIEWIDMHNFDQKKLGKGLGELHLKSAESNPQMFGFPVEGFIGTTDQKKGLEDNWADCFLNLRIIPQLLILKPTITVISQPTLEGSRITLYPLIISSCSNFFNRFPIVPSATSNSVAN